MANEQQKGSGTPVPLRERYQIFPGSPLPDLNSPSAQAFLAEDKRDPNRQVFALIVRPGFPARTNAMRLLKGVQNPGLMTLLEWGVTDWPPANRKVMAVVYERPTGGRITSAITQDFRRIDESDVVRKVITPLSTALKELRGLGLTHRAIRPTNMFWASPEKDRIVLGDCATCPPAMEQPAVIETVESAMAHPAGRGQGTSADDYYSFGASLIMLLTGRHPAPNWDDDQIIRSKIIHGSYAVLVGEQRLPLATIEVLRGLLCDDPQERWSSDALEMWMSGRRLTPLLTKSEKRASRGFNFNGKDYFSARELGIAFSRNWDAAIQSVADGRLELWLRRSLDQAEKAGAIASVVQWAVAAAAEKKPAGDIMLTKTCMILDSMAPIRYKGLAVMPDGIGALLAVTMVEAGDVRIIAELLMREGIKAWLETRAVYNPDNSMLETRFREQKLYLDRGSIGTGVERVLYELNDSMPCISPLTVNDYVLEIRDLLPALNANAKGGEAKGWPIDRHVAAFIGVRANFDIERQMFDLSEPKADKSALAMLNMLALIQWRVGQSGFPALGTWVGSLMGPVIAGYNNREKRRDLEKEIPRVAKEGNLVELARLLDNAEERVKDQQGFDQARADWSDAQKELDDIKNGTITNDEEVTRTARQLASLISMTLCFIVVSLTLLSRLL